jgi:hypothetical protein
LAAQVTAFGLVAGGVLKGPARNLFLQMLAGGGVVLLAVLAHSLRYFPERFSNPPSSAGVSVLAVVSFVLVVVYFLSIRALLAMPYDLACWSEPMIVIDIIKLRTGHGLYQPASDSNSNTYTFLAPLLTYFLAWIARHPASIPAYRLIQQLYLAVASLLTASATQNLVRIANPDRQLRPPRVWFAFFALTSFLFATNDRTNFFTVYLHNDAVALLVSTLAFWLMTKHAVTRDVRWLWPMAAIPALGFLAKQYLAIWLVIFLLYLWLGDRNDLRRLAVFVSSSFSLLAATILGCRIVLGSPFSYWVFGVLRDIILAPARVFHLYEASGWYLALGVMGALVLLRGRSFERLLGIVFAWLLLLVTGFYTSGLSFHPSHLGSATMIAASFFLAAIATLWPRDDEPLQEPRAHAWLHLAVGGLGVVFVFAGLHFTAGRPHAISPDLSRYVQAIEREFDGQPVERVLLDSGDWFYLEHGVLMKDRVTLLLNQTPSTHFGLADRIQNRYYRRILVHRGKGRKISYDMGRGRGFTPELEQYYREVRRIPGVEGMEDWPYYDTMLTDVVVFEPIQSSEPALPASPLPAR